VRTIVWARHGENVANLSQTLSHRVFDGDLTPAGRRQAADLAAGLTAPASEPVGQIVCSPLRRARQTADIVADQLRIPVVAVLEDLRELNVGDLDGRSDPQAWHVYRAVLAAWRSGDDQAAFPAGENRVQLCARILRALLAVAALTPAAGRTLVVAHGGALREALPLLTGEPDPGTDLATGSAAVLQVAAGATPPVRLLSWAAPSA
jgi:broad specificity phosphatase PhoE